jgi:hypothetical protein
MQEIIQHLRQGILSDVIEEKRATARACLQLATEDQKTFIRICHILVQDQEIKVRKETLRLLAWYGKRDDVVAESAAKEALSIPELRYTALFALGTVGTAGIVPLLFEYAERSPEDAHRPELVSLAKQVRTEEHRCKALALAREALLSSTYYTRDAALQALHHLSTAAAEEDVLLTAYRLYHDELVAWALGATSHRMLPVLYELLAGWEPGCAEHGDMARAIERMKIRIEQGEEADPAKRHHALSMYL